MTDESSRFNEAIRLRSEGKHQETIRILSDLLVINPSYALARVARGVTHLVEGQSEQALEDLLEYRRRSRQVSQQSCEFIGVALWCTGERERACSDWADQIRKTRSQVILYTDPAGGVAPGGLLYWASLHPGLSHYSEIAREWLLEILASREARREWPRPVAQFLMGIITEEDLLSATQSKYDVVQGLRQIEARFYIGAQSLERGDFGSYQKILETVGPGPMGHIGCEFILAKHELDNGQPPVGGIDF
ncbi:hypothetical protein CCAX7_17680 [Capsulimonas corticalis]|uniref:Uncharacterized protein n=1 Tax=Capsulimonas corticalis TaxID=2219043 RepID=A0A402D3Q2_9BACT|nr:hypothetical protein [Capsulimonas corticalis]BDI29717.1 hypothetical protein CCAX7_17680 [Capsulimonas corticalis]